MSLFYCFESRSTITSWDGNMAEKGFCVFPTIIFSPKVFYVIGSIFCVKVFIKKRIIDNFIFPAKIYFRGLCDLFKKQIAQSLFSKGFTQTSRLSLSLYLKPSIPALSWSMAIKSLLVNISCVCFVIFLKSLPAISGAASIHHSGKMRSIFVYTHTVTYFQHVRIIPVAGASVFSQADLLINNGHYACLLPGAMIDISIKNVQRYRRWCAITRPHFQPTPMAYCFPIRKG